MGYHHNCDTRTRTASAMFPVSGFLSQTTMTTNPSAGAAPITETPQRGARLPFLNAAGARPRLAASLLRTASTTSLSTTASTADSMAVNAPSTRSVSPATVSGTPPLSIHEDGPASSEPLTHEKLEKFNQETERKVKVGYKNIPSLDAIAQRLAKARSISVDGSTKPPEAEMIEDPKTPGVPMKAPEHPLEFPW